MSAVYFIDVDTRRRAACDLVQALCKSFEGPVIQNFSQYVQGLLQVSIIIHAVSITTSHVVMPSTVTENKKYFLKAESLIIMFD